MFNMIKWILRAGERGKSVYINRDFQFQPFFWEAKKLTELLFSGVFWSKAGRASVEIISVDANYNLDNEQKLWCRKHLE